MKQIIETGLLVLIFLLQLAFLFLIWTGSLLEISKPSNEIISAVIQASATIFAAIVAVMFAFSQLRKQFEHKVIHEAWSDFQEKLHGFSSELTEFSVKVQSLFYLRKHQENRFLNGGSKDKYRQERWKEFVDSHGKMLEACIEFLRSYETNEIVFLDISHAKKEFQSEFRKTLDVESFSDFVENVFPEMYGKSDLLDNRQFENLIDEYWNATMDLSVYLSEDLRRLLQNETIGKILNRKVEKRKPEKGRKILLKDGFKIQK